MTTLVHRVAARYAQLGRVAARSVRGERVGDPKEFLREFEAGIARLTVPADQLAWAKKLLEEVIASGAEFHGPRSHPAYGEISDVAYKAMFAVDPRGSRPVTGPGHALFLAILQTYTLAPGLRKKVEIASRAYLKPSKPRLKARSGAARFLEVIVVYEKFMTTVLAHRDVARLAIASGKEHSSEGEGATKIKAGPFTLVNTGGFDAKQMAEVVEVMEKAATLARSSGLGEVCYGEVQVTNTIHGANVLAFYLIAKDELFVRANVKASTDFVQTVLHELGHRYEKKFLRNGPRAIETLFETLKGQERTRTWSPGKGLKHPEPGDTLEAKGKTYVVTRTAPGPGLKGYKVHLQNRDKPEATATVALDAYWELKGEKSRGFEENPEFIGFVSEYAKRGGPSENFAEMFSFYCMGSLPVLQSVPFEATVFGTEKTATARLVHRVACRHASKI